MLQHVCIVRKFNRALLPVPVMCLDLIKPIGKKEARLGSHDRASACGAVGHWIDPSWWTHFNYTFFSSQISTGDVTKALVCTIYLSIRWCI